MDKVWSIESNQSINRSRNSHEWISHDLEYACPAPVDRSVGAIMRWLLFLLVSCFRLQDWRLCVHLSSLNPLQLRNSLNSGQSSSKNAVDMGTFGSSKDRRACYSTVIFVQLRHAL
jgi:hypothetical protein